MKRARKTITLSAVLTPLVLAPLTNAAVLAEFGFTSENLISEDTEPNSLASTLVDTNVTGSALTYETRAVGTRGNPTPSLFWTVGDYNDGFSVTDDYLSFTITPDPGYQITFTSLSVDHFNSTNAGSTVSFFSDQAGFGSEGDAIGSVFLPDFDTTSNFNASVSLGGLAVVTAATEFRIYFDTEAGFTTGEVWTDNIVLSGDVTQIPEPSALALIGLGGWALFRRRSWR